jgi:uncharacterized protein YfcZ (UPF0381/DUF406 family)
VMRDPDVTEAVERLEDERDQLKAAIERIIETARAGDWDGPEIPAPVGAEIARAGVVLRMLARRRAA